MKRFLALALGMLLIFSLLSGCGPEQEKADEEELKPVGTPADIEALAPSREILTSEEAVEAIAGFKTIGDILQDERAEESQNSADEKGYIYVFDLEGDCYRVTANLPQKTLTAIVELDYTDPDYDEKYAALVSPLEIKSYENLSADIPTQEMLDKLVGLTGGELVDRGWSCWGQNLEDMTFYMYGDLYAYNVVFDGKVEYSEDLDANKEIKNLQILSITYAGLGDVTKVE